MQKLIFRSTVILLIVCPYIYSCAYDEVDEFYESREAAEQSKEFGGYNPFQRGWIPEWIPESSRAIKETHDLDTNEQILGLQYSTGEDWDVPSICSPIASYKVRYPRLRRSWWPSDLHWGSRDYQIYSCVDGYLAIRAGQLFFWR